MLLVVRQNYCDRVSLGSASRQFEFVGARILGVVFNCTSENRGKYYGKSYYKRYYRRRYYKRYKGYGYNNEIPNK
jgi:Mrp family chromosome partitioning ATPase